MDISTLTLGELEQLVADIKEQLGQKLQPDISFPPGSVPVGLAAKVYGKDPCWVRAGIIAVRVLPKNKRRDLLDLLFFKD